MRTQSPPRIDAKTSIVELLTSNKLNTPERLATIDASNKIDEIEAALHNLKFCGELKDYCDIVIAAPRPHLLSRIIASLKSVNTLNPRNVELLKAKPWATQFIDLIPLLQRFMVVDARALTLIFENHGIVCTKKFAEILEKATSYNLSAFANIFANVIKLVRNTQTPGNELATVKAYLDSLVQRNYVSNKDGRLQLNSSLNDFVKYAAMDLLPEVSEAIIHIREESDLELLSKLTLICQNGYLTAYEKVELHARNLPVTPEHMQHILDLISSGKTCENFYVGLESCGIRRAHICLIAPALMKLGAKPGLHFNFSNGEGLGPANSIDSESVDELTNVIALAPESFCLNIAFINHTCYYLDRFAQTFATAPNKLRLKFSEFSTMALTKMAKELKSSTAVIELDFSVDLSAHQVLGEQYTLIQFYLKRNQLIHQYPEFAGVIKKLCYDRGLYSYNFFEIPSLRVLSASKVRFLTDPAKQERLPADIKAFLNQITDIVEQLETSRHQLR